MTAKTFTRSFAGGEIAPTLFGRVDLAKFQTGLALCRNFRVTPQGPIENRAGFEYVLQAKAQAILIPFTFNADQSFALEFGDHYIRFHTQGATLLEAAQGIIGITGSVLNVAAHGYTTGDWVFLTNVAGVSNLTGRWVLVIVVDANHFSTQSLVGVPIVPQGVYSGGGVSARVYELATPYALTDLLNLHYVQSADVLTIVHAAYPVRELRRLGATNWTLTVASFVPSIAAPAAPTAGTGGPGGGTPVTLTYVTTAVAANTQEESLASGLATASQDLTVAGNFVNVTPAATTGAVRYNVYKLQSGIYGYIGQTDGSAFKDNNILPDMSKTPPLTNNPFATENPQAVSYFEQRRVFGGSNVNPQNVWATRSATESNMTYSIPTQDDDAITARIVSRSAQVVRHLVPLNDLLAFTSGGVWRLSPASGEALTPASISPKQHASIGASMVTPVMTSSSVLYAPERGAHIREVAYQWQTQKYDAADVCVLAPHLFDYKAITQMTYSETPIQIVWVLRTDAGLLGMTYQPEHDVKAWHQHVTRDPDAFESACAIPEGSEDGLYVVVRRTISGHTVRYIERQHTRRFDTLADAFFVDAGATYEGVASSVISGLWHLEGESVVALADGGVEPAQTVTGGTITLSAPASKVHVGFAYNCDVQTLPMAIEAAAAFGQGIVKNINEVALRVVSSSGIFAGPSFDKLTQYPQRSVNDAYGTPPALQTGIVRLKLTPTWQEDGSVCVRQASPLPLTLLSMTLDGASGG